MPGVDARLAVERQVVGVLGDEHVREQADAGRPRSIGIDGMGAYTICSHERQLRRGRTWRTTRNEAGT